ncbi:MAG TPA: SpoIIE family protein phosphatase [Egibacteraceae bacterium]|nr:SpoIIE family protein phosphatase [Egibacteraceae bacterium]
MSTETGDDEFARLLDDSAEDLYENAPCGYLSTLPDGTIAKVNATFLTLTGYDRAALVGKRTFQSLLAVGDRIFYETHYAPLVRMQQGVQEIAVEIVRPDGGRLPVLVNTKATTDRRGALAFMRTTVFDARQRRAYERELLRARQQAEESEARARELARTLQDSFLPPEPPAVPGLDVGAAFRPAGGGDLVGGDFFDVFETGDGEWVAVLGDVQGKGVEAARVTALARHTLRAAAMSTRSPAGALTTLNEALRRSGESRFCTVVYARLLVREPGAVSVTLAAAGHAPPILVDGAARAVDVSGDLLGVLDHPVLPEAQLTVTAGEALCLFTDGVTEGRRDDEYYGEHRLMALLERSSGMPAARLARHVVDDVVRFQRGTARDDIAVMVLRPVSEPS